MTCLPTTPLRDPHGVKISIYQDVIQMMTFATEKRRNRFVESRILDGK